jgi:restriction system protein
VLASFFDRIWNPQVSVLYEHLIQSLLEPAEQTLLDGRGTYWEDLIDRLAADPNRLYGLDPREFEQLVMELLSRDGFDCHLTPASHDGGYDILARFRTPASSVVYLVECKRFAAQKPVGVSIVRALFGVVESQSANVGLIVTTSHLSREARNLKAELHYRMESREYDDLVAWLKKHSSRPSQTTET